MSDYNGNTAEGLTYEIPAVCRWVDRFVALVGKTAAWLNVILVLLICLQVVLRYVFHINYVSIEEAQWHLYGVAALFGISYCTVINSHIRLDLLHQNFSPRTKEIVEALGILLLVMPTVVVLVVHGVDFVESAWRVSEASRSPMGLCCRWAIKTVIPVSMGLFGLAAFSRFYRSIYLVVKGYV